MGAQLFWISMGLVGVMVVTWVVLAGVVIRIVTAVHFAGMPMPIHMHITRITMSIHLV